ncbi:hypothetical protein [Rhizobium sp. BK251]|uniref:hypothetical protein n=1 Tax=Rhizobium sp. BK251 TaxID=2512125 RepID=UPI00104C6887|nr:hypothetical protein [Rhizobium sp. BK251]TCL74445.1 hypothetical protein EV286_1025 [Rhizobium sp. BK251]
MPDGTRFEKDSKRDQLFHGLISGGLTLADGQRLSDWSTVAVRAAYHKIAKSTGRKLIHSGDLYKLGGIVKSINDATARHGRGR